MPTLPKMKIEATMVTAITSIAHTLRFDTRPTMP